MPGGNKALIGAAVVALAAVAAMLVAAVGDDTSPATASSVRIQHPAHPDLRVASGVGDPSLQLKVPPGQVRDAKKSKRKRPSITDLVTTAPVTVDANSSRIAVLSCGKSQGLALDGGVIAPPAPAQVVVTMLSRANPNPPYSSSRRNYYVGVRNLDPVNPANFRASIVCAKGIDVK